MVGHGGEGRGWSRMRKGEVPGRRDPPAGGLSHPPTQGSEEGALLVSSKAPTVYPKAPGRDSDDTGASLRWLEPPIPWAVTLPSSGQGGVRQWS